MDITYNQCTECVPDFVAETTALINVFPNPADEIITLQAQETVIDVIVYDMLGNAVLSEATNNTTAQLDISGVSPGMYVLVANGSTKQEIQSISIR